MIIDRILVLTLRIFFATIAVNIVLPDGSIWERSIASVALALMSGVK